MASVNDCWDQAIFVDDRLENVAAPQRLGIHGIRYVNGMDLPAALAPLLTVS
jgi:FMN phosphatase YigB (HAD superfamily)